MEGKVIHSFGDSFNTDFLYIAPPPLPSILLWGVKHFLNIFSSRLHIVDVAGGGWFWFNISSALAQALLTLLLDGGGGEFRLNIFSSLAQALLTLFWGVQHFLSIGSSPLNIVLGCPTFPQHWLTPSKHCFGVFNISLTLA